MAGFKTHITTSTALSAAFATVGYHTQGFQWPTCVLAGGLGSIAGMLPDLDSDTGTPLKETSQFMAAVIPMLMLRRWNRLQWSHEMMILGAMVVYALIRFGFINLLRQFTVHRGMFHSIPALVTATGSTYLLAGFDDVRQRQFVAGAVGLGFLSHLVLDEIWSLDLKHLRVKSSFGTAIKFWGPSLGGNLTAYALTALVVLGVLQDGKLARSDFRDPNVSTRGLDLSSDAPRRAVPRVVAQPKDNERPLAPAPRSDRRAIDWNPPSVRRLDTERARGWEEPQARRPRWR